MGQNGLFVFVVCGNAVGTWMLSVIAIMGLVGVGIEVDC